MRFFNDYYSAPPWARKEHYMIAIPPMPSIWAHGNQVDGPELDTTALEAWGTLGWARVQELEAAYDLESDLAAALAEALEYAQANLLHGETKKHAAIAKALATYRET